MLDAQLEAEVRTAAEEYCIALHRADWQVLEELCHDKFFMTSMQPDGQEWVFDKAQFVDRARAREPFAGAPSFAILSTDVEPEMAQVKLWVDMPPRRFCDYLGFMRVGDRWKLVTKLFRTADGPALGA